MEGLTSIDLCNACPAGTYYNPTWNPSATSGLDADRCVQCPIGSYSTRSSASTNQTCIPCPLGYRGTFAGATSQAEGCAICPAGRFSSTPASGVCTPCAAGSYSTVPGGQTQDDCLACPAGSWSNIAGASSADTCRQCRAGYYYDNTTCGELYCADACVPCPAGTWSAEVGASSPQTCQSCPAGSWNNIEGLSSETYCRAWCAAVHCCCRCLGACCRRCVPERWATSCPIDCPCPCPALPCLASCSPPGTYYNPDATDASADRCLQWCVAAARAIAAVAQPPVCPA